MASCPGKALPSGVSFIATGTRLLFVGEIVFAKIFEQIFDSSIAEDWKTRLVFEDMLVLADQNGVVDKTYEAIARRTNVPLDIVRQAISILESPDTRSRNPNHEGRRIVRLDEHRDWGWMIVNYEEYRKMASEEQRRQKTLERVRKYREKQDAVTPCNASLRSRNDSPSAYASSSTSSPEEGDSKGEPAVIEIPLSPRQGEYGITQSQIDQWRELFPGVDVPQTLREIKAWNLANPTRRKTRRGIEKHIVAWLSKEQCKA